MGIIERPLFTFLSQDESYFDNCRRSRVDFGKGQRKSYGRSAARKRLVYELGGIERQVRRLRTVDRVRQMLLQIASCSIDSIIIDATRQPVIATLGIFIALIQLKTKENVVQRAQMESHV